MLLSENNGLVSKVDQYLNKRGDPNNRITGSLPYSSGHGRTENQDSIVWSMDFSGGFGDGGYTRTVTYDKNEGWFHTAGIDGWGYSNLSQVIDEFMKLCIQSTRRENLTILCPTECSISSTQLYVFMKKHNVIYTDTYENISEEVHSFSLSSKDPVYCLMAAFGIEKNDYQSDMFDDLSNHLTDNPKLAKP